MTTATLASMTRRLACLETARKRSQAKVSTQRPATLRLLRESPDRTLALAGFSPDTWQRTFLSSSAGRENVRALLLCSRQSGKSLAAAALSLWTALCKSGSLVLLLSPTLRQSSELFREKLLALYDRLGRPVPAWRETATELCLHNGSRVVSLPETETGVRGFSDVSLLVVDEASRVSDGLYRTIRPMLAVSRGGLLALSTPCGRRGWFFEAWEKGKAWQRVKVTADQCPRIDPEFLAEERRELGERYYSQEYECEFCSLIGAAFDHDSVQRAISPDVLPLFLGR